MSVLLFPGQGSQQQGMGSDLFEQFPDLVSSANTVLGYDIVEMCHSDQLNKTLYTQPLIYCVSAMTWLQLENNTVVDSVLGHSLGEYAALYAADVFDFTTGLTIVKRRAELMNNVKGGAMVAIVGMDAETVSALISEHQLNLFIANYNSRSQVVLSGSESAIESSASFFSMAHYIKLNVSGAFHSPLMQASAEEFDTFIHQFTFRQPKYPIIFNATAKPYEGTAELIPSLLSQQLVRPVFWHQSIQNCLANGATDFLEVGPGTVLTSLLNRIRKDTAKRT